MHHIKMPLKTGANFQISVVMTILVSYYTPRQLQIKQTRYNNSMKPDQRLQKHHVTNTIQSDKIL